MYIAPRAKYVAPTDCVHLEHSLSLIVIRLIVGGSYIIHLILTLYRCAPGGT